MGIDILHHVEISAAVAECLHVLKPGGTAIFREFCEAPVFDRLRNTALVRIFFPKHRKLDARGCITDDERKLDDRDLELIRRLCPQMKERRFTVLARLDRFLRQPGDRSASTMEKFDYWLCGKVPGLSRFGGSVVLELRESNSHL